MDADEFDDEDDEDDEEDEDDDDDRRSDRDVDDESEEEVRFLSLFIPPNLLCLYTILHNDDNVASVLTCHVIEYNISGAVTDIQIGWHL
jgi:hypothetical protein